MKINLSKDLIKIVKGYMFPILIIILVILAVPLVFFPQLERIRDKNIEVEQARQRLEKLEKKVADLEEIDESQESADLLEVEKAIPTDQKLAPLVVGLRTMTSEVGMVIGEMEFINPGLIATPSAEVGVETGSDSTPVATAADDQNGLNFRVELRGNLAQMKDFLDKVEGAKRIMLVRNIGIQQGVGDYSFRVDMFAPVKPLEGRGDIISQSLPQITPLHERILTFIKDQLINYTNVVIPTVGTGVVNPF